MPKDKQVHIRLPAETHRFLHILCKLKGIPVQELLEELINEYLAKNAPDIKIIRRATGDQD